MRLVAYVLSPALLTVALALPTEARQADTAMPQALRPASAAGPSGARQGWADAAVKGSVSDPANGVVHSTVRDTADAGANGTVNAVSPRPPQPRRPLGHAVRGRDARTCPGTAAPAEGDRPGGQGADGECRVVSPSLVPRSRLRGRTPPVGPYGEASGWRWPLWELSRPVRGFDPPAERWLAGHRGVDLAAGPGDEVRAAGPGTVGLAERVAGRGVVTIIHAGGLRTTYLPVRALVRPGDVVVAGQVIGAVEETATAHCGTPCPHRGLLHWGLLRGRVYLDPLLLFGRGQVRLLPRGRSTAESA